MGSIEVQRVGRGCREPGKGKQNETKQKRGLFLFSSSSPPPTLVGPAPHCVVGSLLIFRRGETGGTGRLSHQPEDRHTAPLLHRLRGDAYISLPAPWSGIAPLLDIPPRASDISTGTVRAELRPRKGVLMSTCSQLTGCVFCGVAQGVHHGLFWDWPAGPARSRHQPADTVNSAAEVGSTDTTMTKPV